MRRVDQKGEGKLGNFVWLVVIIAVVYAAWHAAPIFFLNFEFKDKMQEIARIPRSTNDEKLMDMLMKEVKEQELSNFIGPKNFRIQTAETSRKITLDYERDIEWLPGFVKTHVFHDEVDMPLVF